MTGLVPVIHVVPVLPRTTNDISMISATCDIKIAGIQKACYHCALIALRSQAQLEASHVNKFLAEVAWSLSVCSYAGVPAEIAEAIVDL
jgi:hypothetical protein